MDVHPDSWLVAVAVLVVVAASGIAAAQVLVFDFQDNTVVQDPLDSGSPITFSWNASTTETKTIRSDTTDSTYLLNIELKKYDGQTGTAAARRSWQDGGGNTIQNFFVKNSSKGVYEQVRRDLMSDGDAYYYHIPKGNANLTLEVKADSSGTVEIGRAAYTPDELSVRTHQKVATDNCGTCHADSKPPHVHQDMGATRYNATDWQHDTCQTCHDNSMTDLHQDCDAACHDGYPIVGPNGTKHGPSQNGGNMVMGEYFCDPSCHGGYSTSWSGDGRSGYGSMGGAHVSALGTDNFCSKCHDSGSGGGGITNQHTRPGFQLSSYDSGCAKCHSVGWDGVHHPVKDNMNLGKGTCGKDGCHNDTQWTGTGWD